MLLKSCCLQETMNTELLDKSFTFHSRLLEISEQLGPRDLMKLCYLCKSVIPKARAKEITEGFQLFDTLEEFQLLSPTKLAFLATCLRTIGKITLAERLTTTSLPYTPSSFSTQEQLLRSTFRSQASQHRSCMEKLSSATLFPPTEVACLFAEMEFALGMDLPVPWWKPDSIVTDFDGIVATTLSCMFSFFDCLIKSGFAFLANDRKLTWQLLEKCNDEYNRFEKTVARTHWNLIVREKVNRKIFLRQDPQGREARKACKYIRHLCEDILGVEGMQKEAQLAENNLYMLESVYYSFWGRLPMYQWLANLLHLAKSSILDLSQHQQLLLNLLTKHRTDIVQNYGLISQIVGEEVLEALCPLSEQEHKYNSIDTMDICPHQFKLVITCTHLLELVALSTGHVIDPHKVAGRLVQLFTHKGNLEKLSWKTVNALCSLDHLKYKEVLDLQQRAIKFAIETPYDVPVSEFL